MRRPCQILGALTAADGLFTAVFSRNYIQRFWGSLNFGPEYRTAADAYAAFPDRALRIIGVAEVLVGAALLLPARGRSKKTRQEKIDIEETMPRERSARLLRELADSLEQSTAFTTTIQGQRVSVPANATAKVEFEAKDEGGEFEFEIKWKNIA